MMMMVTAAVANVAADAAPDPNAATATATARPIAPFMKRMEIPY